MNRVRRVIENGFITWLGIIFLMTILFTGKTAHIIGTVSPVVTPLKIISIEKTDIPGFPSSIISGTSTKLRNCDQRNMNWFISGGENEGSVFSAFLDMPASRDTGLMRFEGIVVGLPPERIKFAKAEVVHDCFSGRVRVVSQFFKGEGVTR